MTTALRETYQRTRPLEPEKQLRDCIDQIVHVEILVAEAVEAYAAASRQDTSAPASEEPLTDDAEPRTAEYFYPSRDIMVPGGEGAFTCLASEVDPLARPGGDRRSGGLDFVGVTCDGDAHPVLGVVQSQRDTTPYALLLRGLACIAEAAAPGPLVALDRGCFRGMLGPAPSFDLDLVIHAAQDEAITPLAELTRDLAESVRSGLAQRRDFPPVLRHIACLRMNPDRFDGRLRVDWRI